jgi:hypothetical protein
MKFLGVNHGQEDYEGLRTLIVPSGIGEFQWAWTKYLNTGEDFCILGLDGSPRRLHQFCEMHLRVKAFGYTSVFDYTRIRQWQDFHKLTTWEAVSKKFGLGQPCALACNPHLEGGFPLSEWLPDLQTTYAYPLKPTETQLVKAGKYLQNCEFTDVLIGISCASYRGADAWKTWHVAEWLEYLTLVQTEVPNARFVLIGGAWDDLTASVYDEDSHLRWLTEARGFPPVGRTDFGAAVGILQGLDAYIGFSSGLGHVAAHCCGTPVRMFWPDHELSLSRTWCDPTLLETGAYVPSAWLTPADSFRLTRPWLRRILEGQYHGSDATLAVDRDDRTERRSHRSA